MNMKKSFIGILAATIILSGCGTSQIAAGDPNAVLAGAAIGSNVGGAIGGLIGDSLRCCLHRRLDRRQQRRLAGRIPGFRHRHHHRNHCGSCHCQCSHSPQKAGGVQLPDRKDTALSPAIRKTAASIGHRPLEDTEYTFH